MKYTVHLAQKFPFASCPVSVEIDGCNILCNEQLDFGGLHKGIYNPHKTKLYVIGHVFGAVCAVAASSEQYALDTAVDNNRMDCFLVTDDRKDLPEWIQELTPLGNASELFDLSDAWIGIAEWKPERDMQLMLDYARAYYSGESTL